MKKTRNKKANRILELFERHELSSRAFIVMSNIPQKYSQIYFDAINSPFVELIEFENAPISWCIFNKEDDNGIIAWFFVCTGDFDETVSIEFDEFEELIEFLEITKYQDLVAEISDTYYNNY